MEPWSSSAVDQREAEVDWDTEYLAFLYGQNIRKQSSVFPFPARFYRGI